MKILNISLLILASFLIHTSCVKENPEQQNTENQYTNIPEGFEAKSFTAEITAFTKASLAGSVMNWEEDDKIAVYDGYTRNEFTITSVNNGTAVFEGYVTKGSEEFYAVYPYSASSEILPDVDGTLIINIPDNQQVGNSIVDPRSVVSIAKSDDVEHFRFRNAVSLLAVSIPNGAETVTFTANGEQTNIAGNCSAKIGRNAEEAQIPSITLTPDTEDKVFTSGTYYISVVPAKLSSGYTVYFECSAQTAEAVSNDEIDLVRSNFIDITEATSNIIWTDTFINTAEDLVNFSKKQGLNSDYIAKINNDIDMRGVSWSPFVLTCQLDGQDHKIYNITADASSFISQVDEGAALKNLTIGSADGSSYDGASIISITEGSHFGVVGINNGLIENIKNFASISAVSGTRIGGIAAENNGTISHCENNGSITLGGTSDAMAFIGGITGWNSSTSKFIEFSINNGSISINNDKAQGIGGIAGMQQGGNIIECANHGNISAIKTANPSNGNSYFGGITGFVQNYAKSEIKIGSCENHGTFLFDQVPIRGCGGIAGIIHRAGKASVKIDQCTNHSNIYMDKLDEDGSDWNALGGILGLIDTGPSPFTGINYITNCENSGNIYHTESRNIEISDGKETSAGGIVGRACNTIHVCECKNTGKISSNKMSINRIGGIIGHGMDNTLISECTNSANVELALECTNPLTWSGKRAGVGGICGFIQNSVQLKNNVNESNVSFNGNVGSVLAAGGILGVSDASDATLTGNTNKGSVSSNAKNTHKAAAGIVGYVYNRLTLSDNKNYADISATGTVEKDIFAGGLIGFIDSSGNVSCTGDISKCTVESKVRAGALFSALVNSSKASASFTNCKIGGIVIGQISDGSSGSHEITSSNLDICAYSYKGNDATYVSSGLSLAD